MTKTAPLLVGITGGIGAGKTTLSKFFTLLGIPVYFADDRAKWLMTTDEALKDLILERFGEESFTQDGQLNRSFLAKTVFSDPENTAVMNTLVHPAVKKDFTQWAVKQSTPYILKEAALLFETGSYRDLHKTILVSAPLEIRLTRVMARDPHRTPNQIHEIVARQLPEDEKKKLADYVVDNTGSKLVIPQLLKIHSSLTTS